jgi:ATP-dependent helicase HrpB
MFPEDWAEIEETIYDTTQRRVVRRVSQKFRDLVLAAREAPTPEPEAAARLLADEVLAGRIELKQWDEEVDAYLARIGFLARHAPELGFHPVDEAGRRMLLEQICLGAQSAREVREREVWPAVRGWLSAEQQLALDTLAPSTLVLPRRRHPARLRYTPEGACVLAAKVQELYDVPPTRLRILGGRYPLTLEILAPNGRPVQVTSDLAAFWANSYEQVKKDLRGRYPKHEWR